MIAVAYTCDEPLKVFHVISGLGVGGAEVCLCRFVEESQKDGVRNVVVSLSGEGELGRRLRESGCDVFALNMGKSWRSFSALVSLVHLLRAGNPDVMQTWMYHADLVGSIAIYANRLIAWLGAKRRRTSPTLVWGVHHTAFPTLREGLVLGTVARLCAWLSPIVPDAIICCADAARVSHMKRGYSPEKVHVIRNGFDTDLFEPSGLAREKLRRRLGLPDAARIVGIAGRYHAIKDFENFLDAAAIVRKSAPDVRYVMMGNGLSPDNAALEEQIVRRNLGAAVYLLGPTKNIHEAMAGLDVFCLSSRSEGLPTVIGEAMSCAIPCVATDVGDTATLIGETGVVVPAGDSSRLADGILSIIQMPEAERQNLGQSARARILGHFPLDAACRSYLRLYSRLILR